MAPNKIKRENDFAIIGSSSYCKRPECKTSGNAWHHEYITWSYNDVCIIT